MNTYGVFGRDKIKKKENFRDKIIIKLHHNVLK